MSHKAEFHSLFDETQGLFRELAPRVATRIFPGEHAMLSVVTIAPNGMATLHDHPEEQSGVLREANAARIQG